MLKWLRILLRHAGPASMLAGLAVAALGLSVLALCAPPAAPAQQGSTGFPAEPSHNHKERPLPDRLPDKPTFPPSFRIPVEPLGFSAPGAIYLGQRNSMASLDFIDENRLLFTFRVPGLMHRDASETDSSYSRQIRAVVLALPAGTVAAEALWTVHDRVRYLWMLKDGHFLLRDRDGLSQGDAALSLKPILRFPGPLLWMDMDPSQQFLVTNSREPAAAPQRPGDVPSPPSAQARLSVDGQASGVPDPSTPEMVVRILDRTSGQVKLVSRTRSSVHLPINADGYIESLRGDGEQWLFNLNFFSGGSRVLGRVTSTCSPTYDFIAQRELLITACDGLGGNHKLVALSTDGRRLWENETSPQAIWPLLVVSPDGSRLARETLAVNHAINAYSPLDSDDIKGQLVRILDAATGKVTLETAASPALDAGGNVAISPSGRRVAVINAGAIEVFDLPQPPMLPIPPAIPPTIQAAH
jgi:hypothetical protein